MAKTTKYSATYQGKIVGTRKSPRPYQFAIIAQHDEQAARERAYGYKPTDRDESNLAWLTELAAFEADVPVWPRGWNFSTKFSVKQIGDAKAKIAGGRDAFLASCCEREIRNFEEYLADGHFAPHVAAWSMSRANAEKAARRVTGNVLAIVPAEVI